MLIPETVKDLGTTEVRVTDGSHVGLRGGHHWWEVRDYPWLAFRKGRRSRGYLALVFGGLVGPARRLDC